MFRGGVVAALGWRMNNRQIEEWINENKADRSCVTLLSHSDKFRNLLKDHAIVSRAPTVEIDSELLSSLTFSFDQLQRYNKALLEGNEYKQPAIAPDEM